METLQLTNDILVYYVPAISFPDGVLKAHQTLHAFVSFDERRNYFGIAIPDDSGQLTYFAAAEELESGELSKHHLKSFTIAKGNYVFLDVKNFMSNIPGIGEAFTTLMSTPNLDPSGIGVEWYLKSETCRCLMKLN